MKILFVNSVYNWGSTGKIVHSLFTRCVEDGIDAAVCYGRIKTADKPAPEKNVYKFGIDAETNLHAALTRLTGRTGCYSFFSTRRLLRFMDEFKPDIVHLHEPHAYFLNLKPFFDYLSDKKIPLVYTFHCEFAYTGKCGQSLDCDKWKSGCGNCPHLGDYPKVLYFDHTASMYAQKKKLLTKQRMIAVAPSEWLAGRARQSFLSDVRVIPNGIDTDVFRPCDGSALRKRLGLEGEKLVLSVVPELSMPHKGTQDVLKLAERMKEIKFVLVGKDDGSFVLPENVLAVGRTESRQELAEYYSMADCFVTCSDMENLPTTCIEAVCCGTAVAGYNVGGTAETAPPPLGKFCEHGDLDALEKNLRALISGKPDRALFEKTAEKFSRERMYLEYKKLYLELLQKKDECN